MSIFYGGVVNQNPRVTLIMFTYNQENFIKESVRSVLMQDYNNLKIVISDDCSVDDTAKYIQDALSEYDGPHNITFNINNNNLGIGRHFSYIMENLTEGELVVACGGDDVSMSKRVKRIVEEWLNAGRPALIAHALEEIKENGEVFIGERTLQYKYQVLEQNKKSSPPSLLGYLKNQIPVPYIGAAIAYRRDVYEKFGTPLALPDFEDHLMYFRALLTYGVHYFPEVLVQYRRHPNSYTASPKKRGSIKPSKIFSPILYQESEVRVAFVDEFRLHQLTTQQWLDYLYAIRKKLVNIDYEVVDELWNSLVSQYQSLKANRGLAGYIVDFLRKTKKGFRDYRSRDVSMFKYLPPLKTVLYGAGQAGRNAMTNLSSGFDVIALCDTNVKLHGKKILGLKVISPQELLSSIDEIDCIIICSMFYYEILELLIQDLGVPGQKIIKAPYKVTMLN